MSLTFEQLVELRQPPVSINDPTGTGTVDGANPLSGILGSILGGAPKDQKARLEKASSDAKDLSGLVRRKKPVLGMNEPSNGVSDTSTKRKIGLDEESEVDPAKKTRIDEADG